MRYLFRILVTVSIVALANCGGSMDTQKTSRTCPDWSSNAEYNHQNLGFSNFGCAYYNNIAVQVENPDDLQQGHGVLVNNGDRDSVNSQKYLTATPITPPSVSSTSATR